MKAWLAVLARVHLTRRLFTRPASRSIFPASPNLQQVVIHNIEHCNQPPRCLAYDQRRRESTINHSTTCTHRLSHRRSPHRHFVNPSHPAIPMSRPLHAPSSLNRQCHPLPRHPNLPARHRILHPLRQPRRKRACIQSASQRPIHLFMDGVVAQAQMEEKPGGSFS